VPITPVPPMTPVPLPMRPLLSGIVFPVVESMPGVVVVPSVSAPAGTPIEERAPNVPEEVWPGDWPSALFPLSLAKLVSRPKVAWLGVPELARSFDVGDTVVVVVVLPVAEFVALDVPLLVDVPVLLVLPALLGGAVTRPVVVFDCVVFRPAVPLDVVPDEVVPVVPEDVVPVVPEDVVPVEVVPGVATAGRVVVVVLVMLLFAAIAPLATSEGASAAVMWAGESVFM